MASNFCQEMQILAEFKSFIAQMLTSSPKYAQRYFSEAHFFLNKPCHKNLSSKLCTRIKCFVCRVALVSAFLNLF